MLNKGLPAKAEKQSKELIAAYEKAGFKYKPGRADKILKHKDFRWAYALDFFDHPGVLVKKDGERIPFVEPYNGLNSDQVE